MVADVSGDPRAAPTTVGAPSGAWPGRLGRALRREPFPLLGVVATFSVFYFVLSFLRFSEFYGSNWDLGINMQALWTNTHGSLLYVSTISRFGSGSFLLVHTTYIAIPVSGLYALAPSAETLLALQAVVVASGAVPLYLIGRRRGVPPSLCYVGVLVYLGSFPILSALLYDFHWEAFVSVEFLWTFYLLQSNRFRWAFVAAVLGTLTLEVFPFLVVGIGLYFAYPYLREILTTRTLSRGARRPFLRLAVFVVVLLVLFLLLTYVRHNVIPEVTGTQLITTSSNPASIHGLGISLWAGATLVGLSDRLLYWFLLAGAFGFLPLLYRQRLLILSFPWFAYTVFMAPNPAFARFGFQYAFIAAPPLAIGFVTGLGELGSQLRGARSSRGLGAGWPIMLLPPLVSGLWFSQALIGESTLGLWVAGIAAVCIAAVYVVVRGVRRGVRSSPRARIQRLRRTLGSPWVLRLASVMAVVLLVAFNLAMSPLNTANLPSGLGNGYAFNYAPDASFAYMSEVVAPIAPSQTVLASDNLFPFVANNPQAYSLLWYPATQNGLPFNATHLPRYVLLSTSEWFAVPSFLVPELFNQGVYGIRDLLYSSAGYPGSIYLFELGYSGPSTVRQVTPFPHQMILCGNDFALGPSGVVRPYADSLCGEVVASSPSPDLSGNGPTIWYGPYATLLAGKYTVTVSLRGNLSGPGPANATILMMNANAAGTGFWYTIDITQNEISPTQWTDFTFQFQLTESHPSAEWRGYLSGYVNNGTFVPGNVQLNFIEIDYTPP